jgi:triphosphoribosyl-dephospho-CoA synthase
MSPRSAFLRACMLDVTVRKPGNVSVVSPGHGMTASQFIACARAAAPALFERAAPVGQRIERAVRASLVAGGCNTNLGIVLLCAPIAAAIEPRDGKPLQAGDEAISTLHARVAAVLGALSVDDAQAAFRAIAAANPGGLGRTSEQDVHDTPSVNLRAAMVLAAQRDTIARQYAVGFHDVFEALALLRGVGIAQDAPADVPPAAVQRVFLHWLASRPDSHIVRKHGEAVAHTVMQAAQAWPHAEDPGASPRWALWDAELKAAGINPGTSADLTVATLLLHALA